MYIWECGNNIDAGLFSDTDLQYHSKISKKVLQLYVFAAGCFNKEPNIKNTKVHLQNTRNFPVYLEYISTETYCNDDDK